MDGQADEGCGHTRADRPDGWRQRTSSRKVNPSREGAEKFIRRLPPPPVVRIFSRAPISTRAALYTLHNDVYPVSTTRTIVPKVNI